MHSGGAALAALGPLLGFSRQDSAFTASGLSGRSIGIEHSTPDARSIPRMAMLFGNPGFNRRQRGCALETTTACMVAPNPERAFNCRLCRHSAPGEMLGIDFGALKDIVYYRASGQVLAHQDANEDRLLTLIEFVTTELLTIHTLWLTCCDWLGGDLHPGRHSLIPSRRNRPAQCTRK